MNLINRIKLQTQYSDLKKLGVDSELLEKAISDKHFAKLYKKEIKQFIKYLQTYSYKEYINGALVEKSLDNEIICNHINSILRTYSGNNSIKYISFVKEQFLEKYEINNVHILNDNNFEKIFNIIGHDIFTDNIANVIDGGYSERLLQFIEQNPSINISKIKLNLFSDKVWSIISSNSKIGDTSIIDLFVNRLDVMVDIIEAGYFDGLKLTYENIPESHNFIIHQLGYRVKGSLSLEQFDTNFIEKIGTELLSKLYHRHCFSDKDEFSKIFQIYRSGNHELIQDIVNYDAYDFSFKNISDEDVTRDLLNTNINGYNKNEVLLNKYFGIERSDNYYIKLFLLSINKANLTDEFKEKYGTIIDLLNIIYNANYEEVLAISQQLNKEKREEYIELIWKCEQDGNELIKKQFSRDLLQKNDEMLSKTNHRVLKTNSGYDIDVYEFTGQPFTMLVHAITNNNMSTNNKYVSQIISNPEMWNSINDGNNHISTSLISNEYMVTYGIPNNEDTVMFGFNNIPPRSLKFTSVGDAGINRNAKTNINYNMRNRLFVANINTVASIDELMRKTVDTNSKKQNSRMWNEVGLSRVNEDTGEKIQPNYIVCMDYISENSKKAAEFFKIPIYLIQRKYYRELPYVGKDEMLESSVGNNYSTEGIQRK